MFMTARAIALLVGAGTFVFLFIGGSWRSDNVFLVPDLILTAALIIAALLPERRARPALLIAGGYAAGVLTAATCSYLVLGRLGLPSLIGAVAAVAVTVLVLIAPGRGSRSPA